jgi:hypothetical protein
MIRKPALLDVLWEGVALASSQDPHWSPQMVVGGWVFDALRAAADTFGKCIENLSIGLFFVDFWFFCE